MKLFLLKSMIVLGLIIIFLTTFEYYCNFKDHSVQRSKANLISKNEAKVEMIILGSSYTYRAINPKKCDLFTASFAMPGTTMNINYMYFNRYKNTPNLKLIIIDLSKGYTEINKDNEWIKYRKLRYYHKLDPENKSFAENFLIKYPLKASIPNNLPNVNKWGFQETIRKKLNIYKHHHYNDSTIEAYYQNLPKLAQMSFEHNDENFKQNFQYLKNIKDFAKEKNIKIILLSPPKHYIYNNYIRQHLTDRRHHILNELVDNEFVYFWNYEKAYESKTDLFFNMNHMNPKGAEVFTAEFNNRINDFLLKN